jgi:hypothetical protein
MRNEQLKKTVIASFKTLLGAILGLVIGVVIFIVMTLGAAMSLAWALHHGA